MDRRTFFGAIAGVALAAPVLAASAGVASAAVVKPLLGRIKILGPWSMLRQLYLVPGSFTTPRLNENALFLERLGFLERTVEDAYGVYWQITDAGRVKAAAIVDEYPDGVIRYSTDQDGRIPLGDDTDIYVVSHHTRAA